ncbi:MAG: hypothetical protein J6X30_05175, partial [Clostridia bacterium]|nr:hypothetical protein [Clostridia bacterium]
IRDFIHTRSFGAAPLSWNKNIVPQNARRVNRNLAIGARTKIFIFFQKTIDKPFNLRYTFQEVLSRYRDAGKVPAQKMAGSCRARAPQDLFLCASIVKINTNVWRVSSNENDL